MSQLPTSLAAGSLFGDLIGNLGGTAMIVILPAIIAVAPAPIPPAPPEAEIAGMRAKNTEFGETIAAIKARTAASAATASVSAADAASAAAAAASSRERLAREREVVDELERRVAKLPALPPYAISAPVAQASKLDASLFIIRGDRIAEIDERNGKVESGRLADGTQAMRFTPKADAGDLIGQLSTNDSKEGAALGAVAPDKGFVFAFIAADDKSIATFYRLRTLLLEKRVGLGWEPLPASGSVLLGGGAGRGLSVMGSAAR